jgi:signal transduction histidine kinase
MGAHSEAILILAATARDAALAARTLEGAGFLPFIGLDVESISSKLQSGAGAILLSEEALSPDLMTVLENFFESQPAWSDLPLIWLQPPHSAPECRPHSPYLARLRAHGNLSVLERPLRQPTLLFAVESAIRARRRQYQVRDLIDEKEADVRRRDEFLAMLGHELRNPLAAIRYAAGSSRARPCIWCVWSMICSMWRASREEKSRSNCGPSIWWNWRAKPSKGWKTRALTATTASLSTRHPLRF